MAFLYEEDRGLTVLKDPTHIGPGVYNVNHDLQQKLSYAPFLSTARGNPIWPARF